MGRRQKIIPFEEANRKQRMMFLKDEIGFRRDRGLFGIEACFGEEVNEEMMKRFSRLRRGHVLEIGCGEGNTLYELSLRFPRLEYYGIDLIAENVRKGLSLQGDAHFLPFADKSFNFVFSIFTFRYLADKVKALQEVYRVLKPKGKAYIELAFCNTKPLGFNLFPRGQQWDGTMSDVFWHERGTAVVIDKQGKHNPLDGLVYHGALIIPGVDATSYYTRRSTR